MLHLFALEVLPHLHLPTWTTLHTTTLHTINLHTITLHTTMLHTTTLRTTTLHTTILLRSRLPAQCKLCTGAVSWCFTHPRSSSLELFVNLIVPHSTSCEHCMAASANSNVEQAVCNALRKASSQCLVKFTLSIDAESEHCRKLTECPTS